MDLLLSLWLPVLLAAAGVWFVATIFGMPFLHHKNDFIGNARALLFPIDWPEPFGLVMIEALACGTPVVAYACGSVPEVIEDGRTGFIVHNQEQAIAAARRIDAIDRRQCRLRFEERFTAAIMARRYLEVYARLARAKVLTAVPAVA